MQDFRPNQANRPPTATAPDSPSATHPTSAAENAPDLGTQPPAEGPSNPARTANRTQTCRSTAQKDEALKRDIEVELASPWQRILARFIDGLIYSPILLSAELSVLLVLLAALIVGNSSGLFIFSLISIFAVILFGIIVYQSILMSRYGYTLGKKMAGIRVVTLEGENAGFLRGFLLRELVFIAIPLSIFSLFQGNYQGVRIVVLGINIVCLVMLFFTGNNRRTLQDLLAGTLVVKIPKSQTKPPSELSEDAAQETSAAAHQETSSSSDPRT